MSFKSLRFEPELSLESLKCKCESSLGNKSTHSKYDGGGSGWELWVVFPVDVALFIIICVCVKQNASKIIQKEFADYIRKKITDDRTHDPEYYSISSDEETHGTTHLSVLDVDGMAVVFTSSNNYL